VHHLLRLVVSLLLVACCVAQGADGRAMSAPERAPLWEMELARLRVELRARPSELDKSTYLREYTGALIDIGRPDRDTTRLYQSVDFDSFDAAAFYPQFRNDRMPAACGITSFFYIKLLQAFGFRAYQYSFGFTDAPYERFVHSVALVEIDFRGARRLVVQDPYLNLTYRTRNGEPMDFFELLSALRQRAYERIAMDAASLTTLLLVNDPALYFPHLNETCRGLMAAALARDDGTLGTRIPIKRDYATLMRSPCDAFEDGFVEAMRQHGINEPFIYAYTLRAADLVGRPDHADLQQKIDAFLR
jgi:hypothetical protein